MIGTAALEDPPVVARIAARQPVAVGLDARSGEVALRGWIDGSGEGLLDVVPRFADAGIEALIVTDISRDGTFSGPDIDGLAAVLARTSLAVIASGGVGGLADPRRWSHSRSTVGASRSDRSCHLRGSDRPVTPWLRWPALGSPPHHPGDPVPRCGRGLVKGVNFVGLLTQRPVELAAGTTRGCGRGHLPRHHRARRPRP